MQRSPRVLPVFAAIIGAVLPVMGCAGNAEYLTEDRLNNGLVIILPGIEGHSRLNENIRSGLVAGGVYCAIPIHPWGRPVPLVGPLITQVDFLGNRLAGIGIAKIVTDYQDKYPDRPVYIVGHSGGGGVAVFAAEAMPEGRQIDGLVLLSASISSAYDLKKALSHCRSGIVNFYNKGDAGLLGVGTIVMGTVDGTHGPSAGLIGFDSFDKPGYEGLYQVKMVGVSEDSHTTSTQAGFVASFVSPWVLSDNWPAGLTDAYVDETGPLPKPPAAGAQLARAANGKPATAKAAPAAPGKSPAATAGTQPKGHVDESLLAAARAKSLAAKQKASPVRTHTTAGPRLPTDETVDPDDSAKARDPNHPNRPSRDEAPAVTPADMLPPPLDPEDEADPAAIAPVGGLRPAPASDVSRLTMTTHVGTHLDTPAHFIGGGRGLDGYRAADFILPAIVIDAGDATTIGPELVEDSTPPAGGAILFRTTNSTSGRITSGEFFRDGVHLSAEAAQMCVDRAVRLVGIDYFSIDAVGAKGFPAHMKLMSAGVPILETINLRDVAPGGYTLICLPLRLAGAEASPVRAVLLD